MIEFEHISKCYGQIVAVDDLSIAVRRGETLALIGPNGAGKTTLIRTLLGLVRPTTGTVYVAGHDAQRDGVAARRWIGYLPQRAALYPNLTLSENLAFLAQLRNVPLARITEMIGMLGLVEAANQPARTLSGGTLQRLGLAQALLADPPILVLDEPTVSLDPPSVAVFKALVRDFQAAGKTIVLASHVLNDVQQLADRIAVLDGGRLVALDSLARLAEQCALLERLRIDLAEVAGFEVVVARQAGAAAAELRGAALEIAVPRERKLAVFEALMTAGAAIRDFHSEAPTLEVIFSELVGRPEDGRRSAPSSLA